MCIRDRDHLDKVILPFWESLKDDEYGGFYGYMDIDLNVDKKAVKGCILNNRILWFFANAYLNQKRPEPVSYTHLDHSCSLKEHHTDEKAVQAA